MSPCPRAYVAFQVINSKAGAYPRALTAAGGCGRGEPLIELHLPPQPFGQRRAVKAGQGAPLPVAAQGGRRVHPRLRPQAQQVLHLDDGAAGGAAPDGPHHAPVFALGRVQVQILARQRDIRRGGGGEPAQGRIVVVRAHIGHAVDGVIVGLIRPPAAVPAVEGKLQHLHAGIAGLRQEPLHGGGEEAQVLRDDGSPPHRLLHRLKEGQAGAGPPRPLPGRLRGGGDGVIGVKAPEMVDAHHVVQPELEGDAAHPPPVPVRRHPVPGEQGVPPPLAVGRKAVRRAAGHDGAAQRRVHLELLRVRPHVGAVLRGIDGQVADEGNAPLARQAFEASPLRKEQVLHALPEPDRVRELPGRPGERGRLPPPQGLRPAAPGGPVKAPLERHEQRVALQPVRLAFTKARQLGGPAGAQPPHGLLQHGEPVPVQQAVGDPGGVVPPRQRPVFLRQEQPVAAKVVQVDEIGVPGERGEGLVGGIAKAGGADGEHLPAGLPRLHEKIQEVPRRASHRAHPPRGGQGGDGH